MITAKKTHSGFSLTEMAIVIVIVGFLVTAIMYGQSIKDKAASKAVIAEIGDYLSAVQYFREKYGGLPGDLPSADRFFTGNADEDGNDDGNWTSSSAAEAEKERDAAWNQLSQAGFIDQNIDVAPASGDNSVPGTNRPESTMPTMGWTFLSTFTTKATASTTFQRVLRCGGANSDEHLTRGVMTVERHRYIDSKIDIPNTPLKGRYTVDWTAGAGNECANVGTEQFVTDQTRICTCNVTVDQVNRKVGSFTAP